MGINELFQQELAVINVGIPPFAADLRRQGCRVVEVEWTPPAGGDSELLHALDRLSAVQEQVEAGNKLAWQRMSEAQPFLEGVGTALAVIPGMGERMLLHAGPPITWERMSGPLRGAVIGAILYEGWVDGAAEAEQLAASGAIEFAPCHEHNSVGPMAGVVSPSMPVFIVHNRTHGNYAYCTLNEGLGKVLRYGAYSAEVLERLKWLEHELAPTLHAAVQLSGGIDLRSILAQMLHMGDEGHNRNKAGTSLLLRVLAPLLLQTEAARGVISRCLNFINGNDHFFLNLSMPACKAVLDAAGHVPYSTLVTAMSRNGTDFGIRVCGTGEHWFTAPALPVEGLYFPGYSAKDANLDIGDSAITETAGIGGFAMAAAPAIVQFVGGSAADALEYSNLMYQITYGENALCTIPALNFRGTPTGIDVRKVVETGILPNINTGIAHKKPGIGQVGAGLVKPPWACFTQALLELAQ